MAMQAVNPRHFPTSIRWAALFSLNFFVLMSNWYTSGIATGFASVAETFHVPITEVSKIILWCVLTQGLANLFWMPLAFCFGKRAACIVAILWFFAGVVWSIEAKTFNELLAARIFANFGAGCVESLAPSMIADMFYERDYAAAMATFAASLSAGSQVGPLVAGYLINAAGWRWFFILSAIMLAVNIVAIVFLLPETIHESDNEITTNEANESGKIEEERLERLPTTTSSQVIHRETFNYKQHFADLFKFGLTKAARERGLLKHFAYLFVLPLPLLMVPGAIVASLTFGAVLGGVVAMSTLNPIIFGSPPYLFSSSDLGLFTFSSFVGIIVAWPIAGVLTDKLSLWIRKRNNDRHVPEHRLPMMIVPFLICPVGLVIFGYTASREQYYVYPAIGAAMATAGLALVPAVMLSYVVDSYAEVAGEILVLVNCCKNVVAFGVSLRGVDWMDLAGVDNMFYEMAGIQWGCLILPLPLYFLGPWITRRTKRLLLLNGHGETYN